MIKPNLEDIDPIHHQTQNVKTPSKTHKTSIFNKSTNKKRRDNSINHSQLLDALFQQLDILVKITNDQHPTFLKRQKQNMFLHIQNRQLQAQCQRLEEQLESDNYYPSQTQRKLQKKSQQVKDKIHNIIKDVAKRQSDMMMYLQNIVEFLSQ